MGWFVAARVVQGAAGGFGITVSRASVGDLFEERALARMYAILTMALVLGTALAPWVGGLITRYAGWQSAFVLAGRSRRRHRRRLRRVAAGDAPPNADSRTASPCCGANRAPCWRVRCSWATCCRRR